MSEDKTKRHKTPVKISLVYWSRFKPDCGELEDIVKDLETSLKKHLINVSPWGVRVDIECPDCKFVTTINPARKNKVEWFCRNCGKGIVYDILG